MRVPHDPLKDYLAHCYLYYTLDDPVITDGEFDKLCLWIQKHWGGITSPHKDYVFALEKGVIDGMKGSQVGYDIPLLVMKYAHTLLEAKQDERRIFADHNNGYY